MRAIRVLPAALAALLVVSACTGATGPGGSASPGPPTPSSGPSAPPSAEPSTIPGIAHKTGHTDVVLRFSEGGGFVAPGFLATEAPAFTLYGDGTVIFRNDRADPLPPVDGVSPVQPFRIAKLSEDQIQGLLKLAIGPGGLGVARPFYQANVADAPSAMFELHAGGIDKSVSIMALGLDMPDTPDLLARQAFAQLADRLRKLDQGGAFPTALYAPDRYRSVLMESGPVVGDARAWPWPTIKPDEWVVPNDPNAPSLPRRVMTPDEVAVLGLKGIEGGFMGLTLQGPGDGKPYSFSLRPLLPDEAS